MTDNEKTEISLNKIEIHLRRLGITRQYKGFSRLTYAVLLVLDNERRLEAVIKEIYMPVGAKFGCSWRAVERSFRTACSCICYEHFDEIYEVTGIRLKRPPTPAELLDICTIYIRQQYI